MSFLNDINELIQSNNISPEKASKIREYINLVINDENKFYNDDILLNWFQSLKDNSGIQLIEKPINQLKKWHTNENGEIVHESGEFFKIAGVEVSNSHREVSGWDQPMIFQKEMGILGILRCNFEGVNHYLLNAKFEPGNVEKFQLSPTLQATYSNLNRAHGGRKPAFLEFFMESNSQAKVVYKKWLCEDGGRFYLKNNLNMLVEIESTQTLEIPDDYRWFTLSQIKRFLQKDNLINPHVRGILCHI